MSLNLEERLRIYTDLTEFLNEFAAELPAFEVFSDYWEQKEMCAMWTGLDLKNEAMQVTACALHVAKRALCGLYPNGTPISINGTGEMQNVRTVGLYLLYMVYFLQPQKEFVKINTSPGTWREICEFIQSPSSTMEMKYIFNKLIDAAAFRFTLLDHAIAFNDVTDYDSCPVSFCRPKEETIDALENIRSTLEEVKELQTLYNEVKLKLNFPPGLKTDINEIDKKIANVIASVNDSEEYSEGESEDKDSEKMLAGHTIKSLLSQEFPPILMKEYK